MKCVNEQLVWDRIKEKLKDYGFIHAPSANRILVQQYYLRFPIRCITDRIAIGVEIPFIFTILDKDWVGWTEENFEEKLEQVILKQLKYDETKGIVGNNDVSMHVFKVTEKDIQCLNQFKHFNESWIE